MPLRDGFGIDAQLFAQLRERSLRSLYCSSDDVRALSWFAVQTTACNSTWRSRDELVPYCFLLSLRNDLTIKPWD